MADAETAVQEAKDMGAAECAPEELAAAEAALAKGKAWASEFCSELEARRMLIDAKAKAEEAKVKCATVEEIIAELELRDIFFDFNRYNIRPDAAAVLQENAEVLAQNPDVSVLIEGYADIRGSSAYNLRLAQQRADSTKAALVNLGVDAGRITTTSGGETTQFAAGSTEEAYQLNRRAHFIPTTTVTSSIGARITIVRN
ncbi:MAG: OmpA family protein [Thermodesulfobacteriota bacterium]